MDYLSISRKIAKATNRNPNEIVFIQPDSNPVLNGSDINIVLPSWCDGECKTLVYGLLEVLKTGYAEQMPYNISFKKGVDYLTPLIQQLQIMMQIDAKVMQLMYEERINVYYKSYTELLSYLLEQNCDSIKNPVELKAMNECIQLRIEYAEECIRAIEWNEKLPLAGDFSRKLRDRLQESN